MEGVPGEPLKNQPVAGIPKKEKTIAKKREQTRDKARIESSAPVGVFDNNETLHKRAEWLKSKYRLPGRVRKTPITEDGLDGENMELSRKTEFQLEQLEPLTSSQRRGKLNALVDRLLLGWEAGQGVDPKVLLS